MIFYFLLLKKKIQEMLFIMNEYLVSNSLENLILLEYLHIIHPLEEAEKRK